MRALLDYGSGKLVCAGRAALVCRLLWPRLQWCLGVLPCVEWHRMQQQGLCVQTHRIKKVGALHADSHLLSSAAFLTCITCGSKDLCAQMHRIEKWQHRVQVTCMPEPIHPLSFKPVSSNSRSALCAQTYRIEEWEHWTQLPSKVARWSDLPPDARRAATNDWFAAWEVRPALWCSRCSRFALQGVSVSGVICLVSSGTVTDMDPRTFRAAPDTAWL